MRSSFNPVQVADARLILKASCLLLGAGGRKGGGGGLGGRWACTYLEDAILSRCAIHLRGEMVQDLFQGQEAIPISIKLIEGQIHPLGPEPILLQLQTTMPI